MTEAGSGTTFIVLPKVPWTDEPPPLDPRGEFERAGLYESGFRAECAVQSISKLGATLQGDVTTPLGGLVTVELATGQRSAGSVDWVSDSFFGVGFKQPVDVLALINRKLVSQPVERRRMPRVELRCTGWLKNEGDFFVATLRNISAGGLQLEGSALPPVGAEAMLYVEGLNIPPGELIWKRDKLAGVELRHELGWALIMPWLRKLVRESML